MGLASITRGSLVIGVTAVALFASTLSPATARAEEAVQHRLTKFGKLSPGEAKKVEAVVSARMKRAADMTSTNDPLRTAVSQALFHTPVPTNAVAAAKVRLRLYAGLTEWALENVFAPQPGLIPACASAFGLPPGQCAALVAASGKISPADAAQRAGGAPAPSGPPPGQRQGPPPQANHGYAQQRPSYGGYGARPAYGGYGQQPAQSHFGRYNSGYRPNAAPAPRQAYGQPRPAPAARPAPAGPMVSAADRRAEYARHRQEQLDRMKKEMEARKAKIVATAGGTERVQRGPSSAAEAEAAGLDKSSVAAPAASNGSAAKAAEAAAPPADDSAPAAPKAAAKPADKPLDEGLLDGLLDDPLGKTK